MGTGDRGTAPNLRRPLNVDMCDISVKEMQAPEDKHEKLKEKSVFWS
jgi:hypothetical protein